MNSYDYKLWVHKGTEWDLKIFFLLFVGIRSMGFARGVQGFKKNPDKLASLRSVFWGYNFGFC